MAMGMSSEYSAFNNLLNHIVSVPRAELQRREARTKAETKARRWPRPWHCAGFRFSLPSHFRSGIRYYALFHFLLGQVTSNWRQENQRPLLARYFKHGNMANASNRQQAACARFLGANPATGPDTVCMTHLFTVSLAFHQAYQARETADYDNTRRWTRVQALAIIDQVDAAFKAWPNIRNHDYAQAYLLSLLGDPKGR